MKRFLIIIVTFLFMTGCSKNYNIDSALNLRNRLLNSNGCTFDAVITADYGDEVYIFSMQCQTDASGKIIFKVTDPETISGITGEFSAQGGKLTFDDTALAFQPLTDDQLSPVSAPWILIHTLRGGYLTSAGEDKDYTKISIDDSYEENALHLDVWLDEDSLPVCADILWKGRRILSLDVRNFHFM